MKTIYLIGFMGSGKTSVSSLLANKLKVELYDTDAEIEQYFQESIPTIFAQKGEKTFRDYEHTILIKLPTTDSIVSTGGGIIETKANVEWMVQHGTIVYLETSWGEIVSRLKNDSSRPLWNNEQLDKKQLLKRRHKTYIQAANYIVKTDGKSPEVIADEIITSIQK